MVDLPITTALIGGDQAVAGLAREESALRRTTAAVVQNTRAQAERAKTMSRWQRVARAAGAAGSAVGRVAGAVGIGGGLGAAAVGVAGLASMFRLAAFYGRANIQAIQDEIKHRSEHSTAMRQAREVVRGQALGFARGGARTEASLDALGVQRNQIAGAGGNDALLALAKTGQANDRNVAIVNEASATFLVSAEQAADAVLKGARSAAEVLTMTLNRRFSQIEVERATVRAAGSGAAQAYASADFNQMRIEEEARSRALDGVTLSRALSREFVTAADPALAKSRELIAENNRKLAELSETMERMGWFSTVIDRLSGESGVGRQYNRLTNSMTSTISAPVPSSQGATP